MRIAQVTPLYESCPPQLCGGTERVASYLTKELVRQGHEVTLFASGASKTGATLHSPASELYDDAAGVNLECTARARALGDLVRIGLSWAAV